MHLVREIPCLFLNLLFDFVFDDVEMIDLRSKAVIVWKSYLETCHVEWLSSMFSSRLQEAPITEREYPNFLKRASLIADESLFLTEVHRQCNEFISQWPHREAPDHEWLRIARTVTTRCTVEGYSPAELEWMFLSVESLNSLKMGNWKDAFQTLAALREWLTRKRKSLEHDVMTLNHAISIVTWFVNHEWCLQRRYGWKSKDPSHYHDILQQHYQILRGIAKRLDSLRSCLTSEEWVSRVIAISILAYKLCDIFSRGTSDQVFLLMLIPFVTVLETTTYLRGLHCLRYAETFFLGFDLMAESHVSFSMDDRCAALINLVPGMIRRGDKEGTLESLISLANLCRYAFRQQSKMFFDGWFVVWFIKRARALMCCYKSPQYHKHETTLAQLQAYMNQMGKWAKKSQKISAYSDPPTELQSEQLLENRLETFFVLGLQHYIRSDYCVSCRFHGFVFDGMAPCSACHLIFCIAKDCHSGHECIRECSTPSALHLLDLPSPLHLLPPILYSLDSSFD